MVRKITEKLREQRRLAVQKFREKKRADGYTQREQWVKKEGDETIKNISAAEKTGAVDNQN